MSLFQSYTFLFIYAIKQNILSSTHFYRKTRLVIITAQVYQDCSSLTIMALRVTSSHCVFNLITGMLCKYLNRFVLLFLQVGAKIHSEYDFLLLTFLITYI